MAGTLTVSTLSDGTNSGSATDAIKGSARAWVNFDGTGTVAIRASYNVSSITDNGTGTYQINFTNAMTDANYGIAGFGTWESNTLPATNLSYGNDFSQTTSYTQIKTYATGNYSLTDSKNVHVVVFR